MRRSITRAARDLKVLQRLSQVPGLTAFVIALLVLVFAILWISEPPPQGRTVRSEFRVAMWLAPVVAVLLGWFATRVRSGSTGTIKIAVATFSVGVIPLLGWRSRAGDLAPLAVLGAFVAAILALVSWWALHIARRLQAQFPSRLMPPHATRRLSLPRDARALRALGPAMLGGLNVLLTLLTALAAAPLVQQGGIVLGLNIFGPGASRHFRRVRAVLALRAQEVRRTDRRAPVVLLRSFADDELALQRTKDLPFLPPGLLTKLTRLSLEELIVAQLWEVGPVVAIGQPGLDLDPIGAPRERIIGPAWQPRVQALLEEVAIVVVVLGQSEGLLWEYEQLSQNPVSVLAILPPSDPGVLTDRWQRFTAAYAPARNIVLDVRSEFPLLVWFRSDREPLVVSGQPRDERSYELAFAFWGQNRGVRAPQERSSSVGRVGIQADQPRSG